MSYVSEMVSQTAEARTHSYSMLTVVGVGDVEWPVRYFCSNLDLSVLSGLS